MGTRAEEDERGASRAYLVSYAADELINWSYDEHGQYQWVVLRTQSLRKDKLEDPGWWKETRWVYYDKEKYRIYEQVEEGAKQGRVEVVAEGRARADEAIAGTAGGAARIRRPVVIEQGGVIAARAL